MIKLRFLDNRGLVPDLIKFWTWSQISHVEFAFDNGYLGAVAPGGVELRSLDYAKPKKEWFGTVETTPEQEKIIDRFVLSQRGKSYDYAQIAGIILHKDWSSKNSWFCSELVFAAFAKAGILLLDRDQGDRITPYDLFISPLIKVTS